MNVYVCLYICKKIYLESDIYLSTYAYTYLFYIYTYL